MIDSNEVSNIFMDCFFKKDEIINDKPIYKPIIVEGIMIKVGFNPNSLEKNKKRIEEILLELPEVFKKGYSFLNLCYDKDNNLWTGSHQICEKLMILGLAIKKFEYVFEKDLWNILPGEMPYLILK